MEVTLNLYSILPSTIEKILQNNFLKNHLQNILGGIVAWETYA